MINLSELKTRLAKCFDHLNLELSQIRTGRATPVLIENIPVDAYQTRMTVKEVASISVSDPQNLLVSPWDKSLIKDIAKAINDSDLHLNAVVDGQNVRVPIPALTHERRKELVKIISTKIEECKNSMRSVRQEYMKSLDKGFSEKRISEDEKFTLREEGEEVVRQCVLQADEAGEEKKSDVLRI